ncbi:MAG TPA: POTRA domain-containing protein [Verrucomicrobiae bacterium]|nr:POTRA domain-containing protein [Verrucomicrobiae bacterium]
MEIKNTVPSVRLAMACKAIANRTGLCRFGTIGLAAVVWVLGASLFHLHASPLDTNRFNVRQYIVAATRTLSTNIPNVDFTPYTGTNVDVAQLVKAASELQDRYEAAGVHGVSVSIASDRIVDGVVTLNAFRALAPQILVSGQRYPPQREAGSEVARSGSQEVKKTPPPQLVVRAYEIHGDTLLSTSTLTSIFSKHVGTNVTVQDILQAAADLQSEYRARGYPTVAVSIPQQQLTNGIVKIRVFEGLLSDILVSHNRYYSSNNVMRALPGLHRDMLLSSPVFQAELDRANANQDRQIYPELEPGDEPNTTRLRLEVKDRLPLHGKIELNNQNSPGTPDLRVNGSVVYNNLWQLDHSAGLQYSFSHEAYKGGNQWAAYDLPLVANYSAFYRAPLANPEAIGDMMAAAPGSFGYDEATRKFRLPPASGEPELNVYASRSTIDTGLETVANRSVTNIPGVLSIREQDVQQDLTINNDVGLRLSLPSTSTSTFRSSFSGGLDLKDYSLTSYKTNNFFFAITTVDPEGRTNTVNSTVPSKVPTTDKATTYLPLALRWDGSERDAWGTTAFGLGSSINLWFSGSRSNLENISGSPLTTGKWVAFSANFARDQVIFTNWIMTIRGDGQWANEPLISNEQYGLGGINSVRGYHEGEVFGDWGGMSPRSRRPRRL